MSDVENMENMGPSERTMKIKVIGRCLAIMRRSRSISQQSLNYNYEYTAVINCLALAGKQRIGTNDRFLVTLPSIDEDIIPTFFSRTQRNG